MSLRCRSFGLLYYRSVGKMPLEPDHADLESIGQSRFHILLNDSLRCRKCRIVIHYLYQYLVGNFFSVIFFGMSSPSYGACMLLQCIRSKSCFPHARADVPYKQGIPRQQRQWAQYYHHVLSSPLTVLYTIVYCTTKSGECQEVV